MGRIRSTTYAIGLQDNIMLSIGLFNSRGGKCKYTYWKKFEKFLVIGLEGLLENTEVPTICNFYICPFDAQKIRRNKKWLKKK